MAKVTRRVAILGGMSLGAATALALTTAAEAGTVPAEPPIAAPPAPDMSALADAFQQGHQHGVVWEQHRAGLVTVQLPQGVPGQLFTITGPAVIEGHRDESIEVIRAPIRAELNEQGTWSTDTPDLVIESLAVDDNPVFLGPGHDRWEVVTDVDQTPPIFSILRNDSTILRTRHLPESAEFRHILDALVKGEPLDLQWADSEPEPIAGRRERDIQITSPSRFIPEIWQDAMGEGVAVQQQYLIRHLADGIAAWFTSPSRRLPEWPMPYVAIFVESYGAIQSDPVAFARYARVMRETLNGPTARRKAVDMVSAFETIEALEERLNWSPAEQHAWYDAQRVACREAAADWRASLSAPAPADGSIRFEPIFETTPIPTINGVVAGSLFDFMGYLTTRPEGMMVGSHHDAVPMVEAFKAWYTERGFVYHDARVVDWQDFVSKLDPLPPAR